MTTDQLTTAKKTVVILGDFLHEGIETSITSLGFQHVKRKLYRVMPKTWLKRVAEIRKLRSADELAAVVVYLPTPVFLYGCKTGFAEAWKALLSELVECHAILFAYEDNLQAFSAPSNDTYARSKAILRVREVADELSGYLDQQAFLGLKSDIESFIAIMTDNRYEEIKIDESLPSGFIRSDGNLIETDLLSTGTLDVLGLALRLSMANYFLKEQEAFLVMDDPFFDMDPGRQSNAAILLKEYSKTKQLIIFTCHPTHADLMGGNRVVLD